MGREVEGLIDAEHKDALPARGNSVSATSRHAARTARGSSTDAGSAPPAPTSRPDARAGERPASTTVAARRSSPPERSTTGAPAIRAQLGHARAAALGAVLASSRRQCLHDLPPASIQVAHRPAHRLAERHAADLSGQLRDVAAVCESRISPVRRSRTNGPPACASTHSPASLPAEDRGSPSATDASAPTKARRSRAVRGPRPRTAPGPNIDGFTRFLDSSDHGRRALAIEKDAWLLAHLAARLPRAEHFWLVDRAGQECGYVWLTVADHGMVIQDHAVRGGDPASREALLRLVICLALDRGYPEVGGWLPAVSPVNELFTITPRKEEITMVKSLDLALSFDQAAIDAADWWQKIDHV